MKRVLAAMILGAAAFVGSTAAEATSLSYLANQGFEIQAVVRYGIDGEREVYLQRDDALFVCWVRTSASTQEVVELGCRQISPAVQ